MSDEHRFPELGRSAEDLLAEIGTLRTGDLDWRSGRAFSLVYDVDDDEHEALLETVGQQFLHENALNPFRYQTLLKMETEVIAAGVDLFGAGCGAMSSGGTESIFLAVQTARDHGRTLGITEPRLLCCDTAHPAFAKACHYLGVEEVRLAHRDDGRADPDQFAAEVDDRTILCVASTPSYPYGVIDPVAEIAEVAAEAGTLCHVDACLGGWLLPWWERIGEPVPAWDFRVPGVTSLSADIHKYGYSFKGASLVLYRDRELYEHQIFMFDRWPGGLYASSSSAGTRPGAPIAGAWTAIHRSGIDSIDGLAVTSDPDLSLFEFGSERDPEGNPVVDIDGVGDVMDDRGWNLDRQQGGLHVMLSPGHDRVGEQFVADLSDAAEHHGPARGGEHVYGGVV